MSVNTYPPSPSGAGVPFTGLKLVTSGTNWTTTSNQSHVYSADLPAGRYVAYADTDNSYVVYSYKNNIRKTRAQSSNLSVEIVLATNDTVWFVSGKQPRGGTLGSFPSNANVQYRYHNLGPTSSFAPFPSTDYETNATTTNYLFISISTVGGYSAFYNLADKSFPPSPTSYQIYPGNASRVNYFGYLNDRYFIVYGNTNIKSSTDGINWATNVASIAGAVQDMTYASASSTYILTACATATATADIVIQGSTDGINWTTRTFPAVRAYGLVYGNGTTITGGSDGNIYSSTDAINWSTRTLPYNHTMGSFQYFNGEFYAFAAIFGGGGAANTTARNTGLNTPSIAKSTDGITWTAVALYNNYTTEASTTASYFPVCFGQPTEATEFPINQSTWQYNNTLYFRIPPSGEVYATTNGTSWFRSFEERPTIKNSDVGMLYLSAAWTSQAIVSMLVEEPEQVNYYIYKAQEQ